jgi:hypothetical protein
MHKAVLVGTDEARRNSLAGENKNHCQFTAIQCKSYNELGTDSVVGLDSNE